MQEINLDVEVTISRCFFFPENAEAIPFEKYDYVVDAVDMVVAKMEIVMQEKIKQIPIAVWVQETSWMLILKRSPSDHWKICPSATEATVSACQVKT